MGKTYGQQQRHHGAEGRSTECSFHGFPALTFPCSRTCSQEAGRCSMAVADREAAGQHDRTAMLFRNTTWTPATAQPLFHLGISQQSSLPLSWEVRLILPGPLHSAFHDSEMPPSLHYSQKSIVPCYISFS